MLIGARTAAWSGGGGVSFVEPCLGWEFDGTLEEINGKTTLTRVGNFGGATSFSFEDGSPFGGKFLRNWQNHVDWYRGYFSVDDPSSMPHGDSQYTVAFHARAEYDRENPQPCAIGYGTKASKQFNGFKVSNDSTFSNYWWGSDVIFSIPSYFDNVWHSLVVTYDGSYRSMFFDGAFVSRQVASGHEVPQNPQTTILSSLGSENFTGDLSNLAVYDLAFTADKALQFHNGGIRCVR